MKVVVMRSSYSTIWRESGDLSCAILSRDGEMIAQGPGDLPAHLATMPFSLKGALQKIPCTPWNRAMCCSTTTHSGAIITFQTA